MRRAGHHRRGQRVAVGVAVVGEHARAGDGQRRVLVGGVGVAGRVGRQAQHVAAEHVQGRSRCRRGAGSWRRTRTPRSAHRTTSRARTSSRSPCPPPRRRGGSPAWWCSSPGRARTRRSACRRRRGGDSRPRTGTPRGAHRRRSRDRRRIVAWLRRAVRAARQRGGVRLQVAHEHVLPAVAVVGVQVLGCGHERHDAPIGRDRRLERAPSSALAPAAPSARLTSVVVFASRSRT